MCNGCPTHQMIGLFDLSLTLPVKKEVTLRGGGGVDA